MGVSTPVRLLLATALFGLGLSPRAWADPDDPPPPRAEDLGKATQPLPLGPIPNDPPPALSEAPDFGESIKPLPLVPIPDDPPPHEGAMVELPYVIEVPDLLLVEVLESLPGRPISGERLVRPDGSITLGFYGEVHVQGLTLAQAKEKIIKHLRKWIPDETLGLYEQSDGEPIEPLPGDDGRPMDEENGKDEGKTRKSSRRSSEAGVRSANRPAGSSRIRRASQAGHERPKPLTAPPAESKETTPAPAPAPSSANVTHLEAPTAAGGVKITIEIHSGTNSAQPAPDNGPQSPDKMPNQEPPGEADLVPVRPVDSSHVFVDLTAYNSKNYYVQGDVASPGKFPWTGRETVLDAMNYAGGLIPSADPRNIRLVRPARAGKPSRVYPVDLEAITERGEAEKNYQLFPGDRLIVGRNPVVKTTIEVDRLAAPMQTVFNSILQQSFAIRSLMQAAANNNATLTPEQRDAIVKEAADFWGKVLSRSEGVALDEKTFHDALIRAFNPPAIEKPAEKK